MTRTDPLLRHAKKGLGKVTLVGREAQRVKRGIVLTDGGDSYLVTDEIQRIDGMWFELENTRPGLEGKNWFRVDALSELGFDQRQSVKVRRHGAV